MSSSSILGASNLSLEDHLCSNACGLSSESDWLVSSAAYAVPTELAGEGARMTGEA